MSLQLPIAKAFKEQLEDFLKGRCELYKGNGLCKAECPFKGSTSCCYFCKELACLSPDGVVYEKPTCFIVCIEPFEDLIKETKEFLFLLKEELLLRLAKQQL